MTRTELDAYAPEYRAEIEPELLERCVVAFVAYRLWVGARNRRSGSKVPYEGEHVDAILAGGGISWEADERVYLAWVREIKHEADVRNPPHQYARPGRFKG